MDSLEARTQSDTRPTILAHLTSLRCLRHHLGILSVGSPKMGNLEHLPRSPSHVLVTWHDQLRGHDASRTTDRWTRSFSSGSRCEEQCCRLGMPWTICGKLVMVASGGAESHCSEASSLDATRLNAVVADVGERDVGQQQELASQGPCGGGRRWACPAEIRQRRERESEGKGDGERAEQGETEGERLRERQGRWNKRITSAGPKDAKVLHPSLY
eukprot:513151-Hanusia_phi.AAC.4